MRVFTCTGFEGVWPTGTSAVVVARDEGEARDQLRIELEVQGLSLGDAPEFKEIPLDAPRVEVLQDGSY